MRGQHVDLPYTHRAPFTRPTRPSVHRKHATSHIPAVAVEFYEEVDKISANIACRAVHLRQLILTFNGVRTIYFVIKVINFC